MSKKISGIVRVAIIGSGGITGAHAKGFLTQSSKIQCVALCDINPEHSKKRNEQFGGGLKEFTDWKTMLHDHGHLFDAVDIALPHNLHAEAIIDSAKAGKHIICEKPMCTSLEDADKIAAAVKAAGVTYMSAHNQLFMPVVQKAKELIEQGAIGQVYWIRSQDCFLAGGGNGFKGSWRAKLATQGGGELIDTGYHPSYRLIHLAGSAVKEVNGVMARFTQPIEGEDTASVQVRFENGIIGEIYTSWAMSLPYGTHHIHVVGKDGQLFGSDNTLYVLKKDEKQPTEHKFPGVDTFEAELAHFADCLTSGKRPIHSVEEGRAVLELILKASEKRPAFPAPPAM